MVFRFFLVLFFSLVAAVPSASAQALSDLLKQAKELQNTRPDSAFQVVDRVCQQAKTNGLDRLEAQATLQLGDILYQQGTFTRALNYFQQARLRFEQAGDPLGEANALLSQGKVKYYVKQEKDALADFNRARAAYKTLGNREKLAETLGEIGHLYEKKQLLDSAHHYQQHALQIYRALNDRVGSADILENLGSIWEDLERYDSAQVYFTEARKINLSVNNRVALVSNLNNMGDVFRKTGRMDSALYWSRKSLDLASELEMEYQKSSALRDIGKTYQELGDLAMALQYKEQARELFEEIYSQENARQMAWLETLYHLDQKNAEIKALESEKRADSIRKAAAFGALAFILLMAVVVWSRQRLKLRKNQLIMEQQQKLHATELENARLDEDRLRVELENKQLQEKHLNLEIESQQRSLGARMLQLIEKNKLLEEVRLGFQEVQAVIPEKSQKKINKVVQRIDYSFNHDREWEEFRNSFEQIHTGFYDHLKGINAELTANDLRLCSLIKINLRSAEIAELLGISTDSLRVARYRLRKKLHLQRDQNLAESLLSM